MTAAASVSQPRRAVDTSSIIVLIAAASALSLIHWPAIGLITLPLLVISAVPGRPQLAAVWIGAFVIALPLLVTGWARLEDHVYFGMYLVLAVGISLTQKDTNASLRLQFRWATAALFAAAVCWKLTSVAYLTGDMFRTVLVSDSRFDPLTRLLGGLTERDIEHNRSQLESMQTSTSTSVAEPLVGAESLGRVAIGLSIWTILIEVGLALAFAAPDRYRISRLRHPLLLLFGFTTYMMVPVVGFALMLGAVGLSLTNDRRLQWAYLGMIAATFLRLVTA